ncbi:MAG: ERCC4 domain-containing protein [bacterium]
MILTIIQDTREQDPLSFSPRVRVEEGHLDIHPWKDSLPAGDYSIKGLEDEIIIERKSLGDLFGSMTQGRERFDRELRQFRRFRFAALVVESDWPTILAGTYRSKMSVESAIGTLMSYKVKYGVNVLMAHDHQTAARLVEKILCLYAEYYVRGAKSLLRASKAASRPIVAPLPAPVLNPETLVEDLPF